MTATLTRRQAKIARRQHERATAPHRDLIASYADAVQPLPSYGATRDEVLKFRQSIANLRGVVKAYARSIPSPIHPSGLSRIGRRRAKAQQARKAVSQ